jgi:hypothetical protein
MNKRNAIFAGILAGLSSTGTVFSASQYPTLQGADLERMRRSVSRVGADFKKVMDREHGKNERKAA